MRRMDFIRAKYILIFLTQYTGKVIQYFLFIRSPSHNLLMDLN